MACRWIKTRLGNPCITDCSIIQALRSLHRLLLLVPQTSSKYLANASATSRSPHLLPTPVCPFVDNAFLCIVSNCRFSRCSSDKVIVLVGGRLIFSGVCEDDAEAGESAAKAAAGMFTIDADGFIPTWDCIVLTNSVVIFVKVCSAFGGGLMLCGCILLNDVLFALLRYSQSRRLLSGLS